MIEVLITFGIICLVVWYLGGKEYWKALKEMKRIEKQRGVK